jgi:hypothetical protein
MKKTRFSFARRNAPYSVFLWLLSPLDDECRHPRPSLFDAQSELPLECVHDRGASESRFSLATPRDLKRNVVSAWRQVDLANDGHMSPFKHSVESRLSSVRKSVWTFVRQLRGPHLRMDADGAADSRSAVTVAVSPSSLPRSSTGRFDVKSVGTRS